MTKEEFDSQIDGFYELIDFCHDNDMAYFVEDIISEDDISQQIDEDIQNAIRHDMWYDVRDALCRIPGGYDYYTRNGQLDYSGLDDYDFDRWKEDLKENLINQDFFDEDGAEQPAPPPPCTDDTTEVFVYLSEFLPEMMEVS